VAHLTFHEDLTATRGGALSGPGGGSKSRARRLFRARRHCKTCVITLFSERMSDPKRTARSRHEPMSALGHSLPK
jgi:hypothetical protein